ncbi:MAG: hypothetical protein SVY53_09240 [Chloroflexota bacterium]|nr:hypothetical protein [Chloroflexota bacterium]
MNQLEGEEHLQNTLIDVEDNEQRGGTLKTPEIISSRLTQEFGLFSVTEDTLKDNHPMSTDVMVKDMGESNSLPDRIPGGEVTQIPSPYVQNLRDIDITDLLNDCKEVARLLRD